MKNESSNPKHRIRRHDWQKIMSCLSTANLEIEVAHEGEKEAREWMMPQFDRIKRHDAFHKRSGTKNQEQSTLTVVPIGSNLGEAVKPMFEQTPHSLNPQWIPA